MKKLFPFQLIAIIFLAGCTNKNTIVTGNLINAQDETVVLEKITSNAYIPLDSVKIDQDGSFKLNLGELTDVAFYRLSVNPNNFLILLLDKSEKVEISGNAIDLYNSHTATGSLGTDEMQILNKTLRQDFNRTDSLRNVFRAHQQAGHPKLDSIANSLDQIFKQMQEEKQQFVFNFIAEHPNSLATLSAVRSLNPDQNIDKFEQVAKNLSAALPTSEYVKSFTADLSNIKSKIQSAEKTKIGNAAPEIIVQTPEGKTIKLSDFKGKITMIDFWAAWCKPCRMENPNVVKVYNRYKDKGFEIFGVSLDRNKDKWIAAIAQDGLTWKHGSELKFWQSSFVASYNLDGIPMTYLLDENGIIIAKGLRGAQLEAELEKLFSPS